MPEFAGVRVLRERGVEIVGIRIFLTLVAAMDRARDADLLWAKALEAHKAVPWIFDPAQALERSGEALQVALSTHGVSQRHRVDTSAWRTILQSLVDDRAPASVRRAVFEGQGDAADLLGAVAARDAAGKPRFPLLRGPKISVMWVRILAAPGEARITSLAELPVAVDAQVGKVSEYLGVTETQLIPLEEARPIIQEAWGRQAAQAAGPAGLDGTAAAPDPALWFFGKWGCTHCESVGRKEPIGRACELCLSGRAFGRVIRRGLLQLERPPSRRSCS